MKADEFICIGGFLHGKTTSAPGGFTWAPVGFVGHPFSILLGIPATLDGKIIEMGNFDYCLHHGYYYYRFYNRSIRIYDLAQTYRGSAMAVPVTA